MVLGSAGAPLKDPGYAPYTIHSIKDYEFGILDVTTNSMTLKVYNNNNQLIDSLTLIKPPPASGPLNGLKTIGPPPNDFVSLTQAFEYLRTEGNGINGALILELKSTYLSSAETFPLTFNAIAGSSSVNTITIRPAPNASGLSITSNNSIGTLNLNGIDHLNIDGRPGGTALEQLQVSGVHVEVGL